MFIDHLTYASIKWLLGGDFKTDKSDSQRITLRTNDLSVENLNDVIRRPFKNGLGGMVGVIVPWDCTSFIKIIEPLIKGGNFKFPNEGTLVGKQFYFKNIADYIKFLMDNATKQLDEAGIHILFNCLLFLQEQ